MRAQNLLSRLHGDGRTYCVDLPEEVLVVTIFAMYSSSMATQSSASVFQPEVL